MMFTMAGVYDNLGLYPRAQALLERTLETSRRTFGDEDDQTLKTIQNLAIVMAHQGRYDQTEKLNRQLLEIQRRTRGPDGSGHLDLDEQSGHHYLSAARASSPRRRSWNRQLLDVQRRVLGPEHRNTVRTIANLAAVLMNQGQFTEAEKLNREALTIQQKVFGADNPDTMRSMSTLAIVLYNQEKYAEAENWNRQTLEIQRRIYGPEHPWTLLAMNTQGGDSDRPEEDAEAEQTFPSGAGCPTAPPRHGAPRHLADDDEPGPHPGQRGPVRRGRSHESRTAVAIQRRVLGERHPDTATSIYNLGCIMAQRGNKDEALALLRQAIDNGLPPQTDVNMDKDSALAPLAGDARFVALVAHAKAVAGWSSEAPGSAGEHGEEREADGARRR